MTLNNDSHTVLDARSFTLDTDIIYNEANDGARSTDKTTAVNQFDNADGGVEYLSRADGFANYEKVTAAPDNFEMTEEQKAGYLSKATYDASLYDTADA